MTGPLYCRLLDHVADQILADARAAAARTDLTREEARAAIMAMTPVGARGTVNKVVQQEGWSPEQVAVFVRDHAPEAEHCGERMADRLEESKPAMARLAEVAREPAKSASALAWRSDVDAAMRDARANGKPVLLRFKAAWVGADGLFDRTTFADPAVAADTQRFVLVEVDATDEDDRAVVAMKTKYKVEGLPLLILFNAKGAEVKRITHYVDAATLHGVLAGVPGGSR